MVLYTYHNDLWFASIFITGVAEIVGDGRTKEEAIKAAIEQLKNDVMPIYLEEVKKLQEIVDEIEEFIHE